VIRLAQGLCQALVTIHAAGVIHRDLKPSNVMLVDGEPLVIDFGIAHLVNATRLTQTGMLVGTPGYLAPEIIRDSQITQAADVHALASTVFFAATGLPPFGTGTFEAVCFNTMEGRAQLDKAPLWLRDWLGRALQVDPAARPDARELLRTARALDPTDGRGTRPAPRTLTMDTVSDLLPPVDYGRRREEQRPPARREEERPPPYVPASVPPYVPAPIPGPTVHAGQPEEQEPPRPAAPKEPFDLRRFVRGSGFVGLLMIVTLIALTILTPVEGGLAAAAIALALRAGEFYFGEPVRPLSKEALVAVGHLFGSLALGIAAATFLQSTGRVSGSHAESLAAGVFTLGLFVLPGARSVRQAASRVLTRVLPGQSALVVSVAVMGPIALITLIVAFTQGM
jgi:serine/threonine kinase PknH